MTRALVAGTDGIERSFAGAVLPRMGSGGQLLAQYSVRLGSTLLRHRTEVAERAARIEAEASSQVKSEFINNISHELRTPLNAIIGFAKLIKDAESGPLDARQVAEYSNFIFDSANSLLDIVNDVIILSKIQSKKLDLRCEPVGADELVSSCASWAQTNMAGMNTKFFHSADPGLAPVEADPEHLKGVLVRLLRNAITFTPDGGRIVLAAKAGPGRSVMFSVSDTGIGMSAEKIDIAMRPFGQTDQRLSRDHGGAGLGLPISRAIVEMLGGFLHLRSTPGEGTDAVVLLPEAGQPALQPA